MIPEKRAELRKLAEAATPGPWRMCRARVRGTERNELLTGHMAGRVLGPNYAPDYEDTIPARHDARYIAAADPTTVLSLLDALDAAEAKLRLTEALVADAWDEGRAVEFNSFGKPRPKNPYRKETR